MNSDLAWSALFHSTRVRVAVIVAAVPVVTLLTLAFTVKMPEPVVSLLIFVTVICWPMLAVVCGLAVGRYVRSGVCIACGYDVLDLDGDDVCPECGRAVASSRQYAGPDPAAASAHQIAAMRSVIVITIASALIAFVPAVAPSAFTQSPAFPIVMAAGFALIAHGCYAVGVRTHHATRLAPDEPRWAPSGQRDDPGNPDDATAPTPPDPKTSD